MNRWPLRWQLALLTTGLVALVFAGIGWAVPSHVYREGLRDLDADLRAVAQGLFDSLSALPKPEERRAMLMEVLPPSQRLYVLEVIDPDGTTLYRSPGLGEGLPALPAGASFETVEAGRQWMRVGQFQRGGVVIRIGMSLHTLREARRDLWIGYLTFGPLALLIVAAGGWFIARRALRPVEEIAATAENITARRLDQRLPVPLAHHELRRLTGVLNLMFDRLEGSFRQATRFTADASHELKTPLTIIQGELETALREQGLTASQEKLLVNLLEETERLTHITQGLLLLSQADAGYLRIERREVDLCALIHDLLEDAEILSAQAGVALRAELPPAASLPGDPNFLRQLLLNLLDNAIKYNEPGGSVALVLERAGANWLVRIGNTGPGIAASPQEHVFDRFYRGDPARHRGRSGHGLGLSLCREIARAHGGEVQLMASRKGWTEFSLALPAEVPAREHAPLGASPGG